MSQSNHQQQQQQQYLSQLRALAQHHLTEIEADKAQEAADLNQAESEIQRYAKMSSYDRRKQQLSPQAPSNTTSQQFNDASQTTPHNPVELTPKSRFRPFQEVLHRLQWDAKLQIDDYVVGYLERFEGIKEMPARSWVRDFSDEEWIPMHRVRYVKRVSGGGDGSDQGPEIGVVWDRDHRLDKFSVGGGRDEDDARSDVFSVDGTSVGGGVVL